MSNLEKVQHMNALMQELENDKIFLENALQKMQEIAKKKEKLEEYYSSEWQDDFEKFPDEKLAILSEDGLWNLFFEVENAEKNILKFLVEKL